MSLLLAISHNFWGSPQAHMTTLILASPERRQKTFRRSFTVSEKIKVVNALLASTSESVAKVARDHCIDRSTLLKWMKGKENLLKAYENGASARRISGAGRPSLFSDEVKAGLLHYVDTKRSSNMSVSPRQLYVEWLKMEPEAADLSESAARSRIYRFMRRNDLVHRLTTHHAQRSRNDPKVVTDWIAYIKQTCETYGIGPDCIANFDETDVQFAMETRRTITYRGQKTVSVRKPDGSGRCTVMLGVSGDGKKFAPYVIYKGKRGGRVERELRKWEDNGFSNGCLYKAQEKAWMNEHLMLDWIEKIWRPFTQSKNGQLTMLIIDQMTAHDTPAVKRAIESCGSLLEFIPKGYTSCLQVCDIGLNKPFKDYMRRIVNDWMVIRENEEMKPNRATVSNWIDHAWNKVSKSSILNSWAHIELIERRNNKGTQLTTVKPVKALGDFLPDETPADIDCLALHESNESSSDEDE